MGYGIELLIALVMMVVSYAISYTLMPRPERNDAVAGNLEVPTAKQVRISLSSSAQF